MAIKFKAIRRGEPGVAGGGTKLFYASPELEGVTDQDDLTKAIEKISTVSGADIRAVLYALVDVAVDSLAKGNIVRLGELGSLRATLSSEGKPTADEVTAQVIRKTGVIFTPGNRIKEMLKAVKLVKA